MKPRAYLRKILFKIGWTCEVCKAELFGEDYFCPDCLQELPLLNKGCICNHCGRKTPYPAEVCDTCRNFLVSLDKGRSVFEYFGAVPKLIQDYKYNNKKYLAKVFAKYMQPIAVKEFMRADMITFVPMTETDYKRRGYNQTEMLANELSKLVGIPVVEVLEKKVQTERQALLDKEQRVKNLLGSFSITEKGLVKGKKVLLVDDVTTTGATSAVIADYLKERGATEVYLLTIASVALNNKIPKKEG